MQRKHNAHKQKSIDKKRANKEKTLQVVCFDLQKCLMSPKSNVSDLYHSKKLATYNFTIYDLDEKQVLCDMWHEGQEKRSSADIGSCMSKHNRGPAREGIIKTIYYSETCGGQQRNIYFSMMCLYSINNMPPLTRITHNFFERRHSQNEGDSVHSRIEQETKNRNIYIYIYIYIYTPAEWMTAVGFAGKETQSTT